VLGARASIDEMRGAKDGECCDDEPEPTDPACEPLEQPVGMMGLTHVATTGAHDLLTGRAGVPAWRRPFVESDMPAIGELRGEGERGEEGAECGKRAPMGGRCCGADRGPIGIANDRGAACCIIGLAGGADWGAAANGIESERSATFDDARSCCWN